MLLLLKYTFFISFGFFLLSCQQLPTTNTRGEITIELTEGMFNRLKGTYLYLLPVGDERVLDSMAVNNKTIRFKKAKQKSPEPQFLVVKYFDIRRGQKYFLPLAFERGKSPKRIGFSSFYADNNPTYIKAHDFFGKEASFFKGSEQNLPYFNRTALQYPSNDSLDIVKTRIYNLKQIDKYPASIVLINQLEAYKEYFPPQEIRLMLERFSPAVKNFEAYAKLNAFLVNPGQFNKRYPSFISFEQAQGGRDTIIRGAKDLHLIVFWASWCAPCRREIPQLKKMYRALSAQGLSMTSISIDTNREAWKQAVEAEKMPWQQLLAIDDSRSMLDRNYAIQFIPKMYLFDTNKQLLAIYEGYDTTLMKKINKVLLSKNESVN